MEDRIFLPHDVLRHVEIQNKTQSAIFLFIIFIIYKIQKTNPTLA
jgi:hypothetical protein